MTKISDGILDLLPSHARFGIMWLRRLRVDNPGWKELQRDLQEFNNIDPLIRVFIRDRLTFHELCRVAWCRDWSERGYLNELNTVDYPEDLDSDVLKRVRSLFDGIDLSTFDMNAEFAFPLKADSIFRELVMTVASCSLAASRCHHRLIGYPFDCRHNQLPPGQYYVGDLCYVLSDEDWEACCDGMRESQDKVHTMPDGRQFFIQNTQVGDGVFFDEHGRNYSVDSGTIGVMLVEDLSKPEGIDTGHNQVVWHGLPFESSWGEGLLEFGPIRIWTDPEESDDY